MDEQEHSEKMRTAKTLRDVQVSLSCYPLLSTLNGFHPGENFWKWVAPGDEKQFENKFFEDLYPGMPREISNVLDAVLIDWLQGSSPLDVQRRVDDALHDVTSLPEPEHINDRLHQPLPCQDDDDLDDISPRQLLMRSLGKLREVVIDETDRQSAHKAVKLIRDTLHPGISGPRSGGAQLGRD